MRKLILIICISFYAGKLCKAQNIVPTFKHIGYNEGLSNSTIETILQDSRGFIWIGTRDGLNKYDGSQMVTYRNRPLDTNSITDNYIKFLFEDSSKMLWIGTLNGLCQFDPFHHKFINIRKSDSKASSHVRDFSQTSVIKPKIILHVALIEASDYWLTGLKNAGTTDFDIIGLSHYTNWTQVNGMNAITANIRYLKDKYKKEVMIVETAYWWNPLDAKGAPHNEKALTDRGYSLTPYGQADYLRDLTQAVIKGGGTGVHYWAPDYMNANGGELSARSLFDYNGNLLYGINFMNYPYKFE